MLKDDARCIQRQKRTEYLPSVLCSHHSSMNLKCKLENMTWKNRCNICWRFITLKRIYLSE